MCLLTSDITGAARLHRAASVLMDGLALPTIARPNDVRKHLAIDLNSLRVLSTGQFSLSPCVHIELSLPVVDPAFLVSVVDCLGIYSALNVVFDSLDGLEDEIRREVREFLYAAVANYCGVAVSSVPQQANFDDWEMPAEAGVWFIFAPYVLKCPLKFCFVPSVRHTEFNEPRGEQKFGHDGQG